MAYYIYYLIEQTDRNKEAENLMIPRRFPIAPSSVIKTHA
jgi:hypothetical protein